MLKKLVSFSLVLVMIMGCLSVTAFAESNIIDEIEPNDTDETMQLIEPNVTVKGTLPATDWESEDAMMDIDTFKFVLKERSKVVLTVTSSSKMVIPAIVNFDNPEVGYTPEIDEELEDLPEEYVIDEYLEKGTYAMVLFDMFAVEEVTYEFTLTAKNAVQTLKKENGVWKYYVGGEFAEETTLVKYNGKWYYVEDGKVNWKSNTLVKYNGAWYYVKNGKWDKTATTLCKYKGTWYYVKNGKKNNTTTLCKYNGTWYYVKNGKVDFDATTLCKYNGTWYYVKNGKKNTSTTLVKYNGTWYYVKSGKKNTATTIVKYNGKKYYVKKGIAQLKFSGKVKISGKTYTVKKGVVK